MAICVTFHHPRHHVQAPSRHPASASPADRCTPLENAIATLAVSLLVSAIITVATEGRTLFDGRFPAALAWHIPLIVVSTTVLVAASLPLIASGASGERTEPVPVPVTIAQHTVEAPGEAERDRDLFSQARR